MLGCSIQGYVRSCQTTVGGCDLLLVGDANDFDFVEGATDADGNATGYASIARRTGATAGGGAYLYEIISLEDTIGVDISQANADGSSSAWEYTISARMAQMSQQMTNFNKKIDAASVCCQLVFIWRNNDGKIFVSGEKYVNGALITKFRFRQDGSKISSGKKFSDYNGQDLSMKSTYLRPPYEFTGGISAISAFFPTAAQTTFTTQIAFASSATPSAVGGVTGAASATDAEQKLEFDLSPLASGGTSQTMDITVGGTQEASFSYLSGRNGQAFRYTTIANVTHTGVFTNGTVAF